ncbi:hypothetical protein MASR1M74_31920 [Lentimicrobium sp.]
MSIARWNPEGLIEDNLKEAVGKVLLRGTRILSGIFAGIRLLNKLKSKDYTDSEVYIGRRDGMKVKSLTTGGLTDVWKHSKKYGQQ